MNNSYRFMINGEENWMKFKSAFGNVHGELQGKMKDLNGHYCLVARLDESNLNALLGLAEDLLNAWYRNDGVGYIVQAKNEGGSVDIQYLRTCQLMRMFERYE